MLHQRTKHWQQQNVTDTVHVFTFMGTLYILEFTRHTWLGISKFSQKGLEQRTQISHPSSSCWIVRFLTIIWNSCLHLNHEVSLEDVLGSFWGFPTGITMTLGFLQQSQESHCWILILIMISLSQPQPKHPFHFSSVDNLIWLRQPAVGLAGREVPQGSSALGAGVLRGHRPWHLLTPRHIHGFLMPQDHLS